MHGRLTGFDGVVLNRRGRRPLVLLMSVLLAAVASLVANVGVAGAHAELESTTPAAGSTVATAPASITMSFTESISIADSGVRIFDPQGNEAPVTSRAEGTKITSDMPANAADGTWTISWAAVSADGHPISGAWVFHIGSAEGGADVDALSGSGEQAWLKALRALSRFVLFVSLFSLLSALVWSPISQTWEMVWAAGAWLGALGLASADIGMISSAGSPAFGESLSLWLSTTSGRFLAVSIGLLLIAHVVALGTEVHRRWAAALWAMPMVAALLSGHGSVLEPTLISAVLTVVHVVAAAVWLTGVVDLERRRAWTREDVGRVTRVATWSVVAVGVSGVALGILRVPASDVFTTAYGRLIGAKVGLFVLVLALAGLNRWRFAPRLEPQSAALSEPESEPFAEPGQPTRATEPSAVRALRRLVRVETTLMFAAIAVGVVLGATPPPSTSKPSESKASTAAEFTKHFGPYEVVFSVNPAEAGSNDVRIEVVDPATGAVPTDLTELKVGFVHDGKKIGPLELVSSDPRTGVLEGSVDLVEPGTWTATIDARRNTVEFLRATGDVNLR